MFKTPSERTQYGMSLLAANRLQEALGVFLDICRLTPEDAQAWVVAASIYGELGMRDEAKAYLRTAIDLEPDHEQAYLILASLFNSENDYANALAMCERALSNDSEYPEAWLVRSAILGKLGRYEDASNSARRVIKLAPENADAYVNLGTSLNALGQHEDAIVEFERAIALQPGLAIAHISLAGSLASSGLTEEAKAACDRAQALAPSDPYLTCVQARILEHQGNYQEAFDLLQTMLGSEAFDTNAAVTLANSSRRLGRSEAAVSALESMIENSNLPNFHRSHIYMALGHLYDDLKVYDKAFESLTQGHRHSNEQFDPKANTIFIDRIIDFFNPSRHETLAVADNESELPIFIVGMPRSGTTLIEQILSSHHNVEAAGELTTISRIATALSNGHDQNRYPDSLQSISTATLNDYADTYLQRIHKVSDSALRITDKMPGNFIYLGLIQQIFPNARIIHSMRDPVDTCLSCYFQAFSGHAYLHDLRHLGMYFRQYERLMAHWRSVLQLPILDVRYEDLVNNMEDTSREIVEFCGLAWDDNCLRFHENTRAVLTASYQQVRRPIYKSSVQRWKHYEAHLQPLFQALGSCNS